MDRAPLTFYDFAPGEPIVLSSYNLNDKPTISIGVVGDPLPAGFEDAIVIHAIASTVSKR